MLTLIVFIIKVVIATITGMFLGYVNKSFNHDDKMLPVVIVTVISSIAFAVSTNIEIFFLACIIIIYSISKTYKLSIKLIYFSTCISGLLIGTGSILEVIFFCIVLYYINSNKGSIENFFSDREEKIENE